MDNLQNITLIHCIDGIMLIREDEQEVAPTLKPLVRHIHSRGQKINPTVIQGPAIVVKNILNVQWLGICQDIPSK